MTRAAVHISRYFLFVVYVTRCLFAVDAVDQETNWTGCPTVVLLPSNRSELTLSASDTLVLECRASGVPVNANANVVWFNQTLELAINSTRSTRPELNVTSSLTLSKLRPEDAGVYRCVVNVTGCANQLEANITVRVANHSDWCSFESEEPCGWQTGGSWQRRNATDGLGSDHTYGPTTSVGHFMQAAVSPQGGAVNMTSPKQTDSKCLSMWLRGNATLVVLVNGAIVKPITVTDGTNWRRQEVQVDPQSKPYNITLSTQLTQGSGAWLDLDDIALVSAACNASTGTVSFVTSAVLSTPTQRSTPPSSTQSPSTSTASVTSAAATSPTSTPTSTAMSTTTTTTTATTTTTNPPSPTPTTAIVPTTFQPAAGKSSTTTTESVGSTQPDPTAGGGGGGGDAEGDGDDSDDDMPNANTSNAGLALGITLAVMVAAACTAAILYRRKRRCKKSTYITFGNPSYSREHLPANDFTLDSPLTLSSNGYTVLA